MWKRSAVFTIMLILLSSVAWSGSNEWSIDNHVTEMGEKMVIASVEDHSYQANSVFSIQSLKGVDRLFAVLYLYGDTSFAFDADDMDIRVDKNKMFTLDVHVERANDYSYMMSFISGNQLKQIMTGHSMKVRIDTARRGLIVLNYTLNGSYEAIAELIRRTARSGDNL
jgi:hypothetical protein